MNNLQKLAKKKEDKKKLVDRLKGAYHAAAKEGDKTLEKADKMKEGKASFSKAMDDSPHLKGKQSKLPDHIQAKILAKKAKKPSDKMDKEASLKALLSQVGSSAPVQSAKSWAGRVKGKNVSSAKEALEGAKKGRPVQRTRKSSKHRRKQEEVMKRYDTKKVAPAEKRLKKEKARTRKARLQAGAGVATLGLGGAGLAASRSRS